MAWTCGLPDFQRHKVARAARRAAFATQLDGGGLGNEHVSATWLQANVARRPEGRGYSAIYRHVRHYSMMCTEILLDYSATVVSPYPTYPQYDAFALLSFALRSFAFKV